MLFTAVSTNPDQKVCYSYVYESFMYKWHSNEWYIIESNVYKLLNFLLTAIRLSHMTKFSDALISPREIMI